MKKSYLTLAAMAMIMVSCSNEVLIDNEDGQTDVAIGFSTFSDLATKGNPADKSTLEFYHQTFAVYASKTSTVNATENPQYVFGADANATSAVAGTICTYEDGGFAYGTDWKYSPARYWDKQAIYNFIAYAPAAAPMGYKYGSATAIATDTSDDMVTTAVYELYGENLQDQATVAQTAEKLKGFTASASATKEDIDIMVSDPVKNVSGAAHTTTQSDVQLTFNHILAKLNVSFAKAAILDEAVVTIKSVKIENLNNKGTYSRNAFLAASSVTGWSNIDKTTGYTLDYNKANATASYKALPASTTANKTYFVESLVMPQTLDDATNMTVVYEIKTTDNTVSPAVDHVEKFTYQADIQDIFAKFQDNYNYFVNFTITPTIITFDASAATWSDQTAADQTIK